MSATNPTEATEYEVGKFYRVPCVRTRSGNWIPVMGPEHEDRAIIGFPYQHWHIDWRFVSDAFLSLHGTRLFSSVVHRRFQDASKTVNVTGEPEMRLRKCKRVMPNYPRRAPRWILQLETAYKDARLRCNVCPHRGLPLDGLPVVDGVVTCPGHGLRWNVKDGTLNRELPLE